MAVDVSYRMLLRAKSAGFTLIEIAIVLVVIGLLLSGGLVALGPVVENAQVTQTNNKLDKIEDALVLYAIQNSCLPCPSDATPATGTEGIQHTNAGADVSGVCAGAGGTACFSGAQGVVPWQTLGITQADATDEWGTLISYHLSDQSNTGSNCDDFANAANANATGNGGFLRTGTTFPIGCLDVEDANLASFNTVTTAAAYVLISHGPDRSGGFSAQNPSAARTNTQASGNTAQLENNAGTCDSGSECHQDDPIRVSDNTYFDDIVRWKTGPVIVYECGESACGNP